MQPKTIEKSSLHHATVTRGVDTVDDHVVIQVHRQENFIRDTRVSGEVIGYIGGDQRKRGRLAMQSDLVIELDTGERFKMTVTSKTTGATNLFPI
jgi:hypothetical protein